MNLSYTELKAIAETVGELSGWDFSRVQDARAPVPWIYEDLAPRYLTPTDIVLDIGTGGGERFLSLAPYFAAGVGIDLNPSMIATAQSNKIRRNVPNIIFEVMDAHDLALDDATFDVILNRHAEVNVAETVRVLRPFGTFITQQVGPRNTLNVLHAFGWTPESFGESWWQPVNELAAGFEAAGCRVVARGEYDVHYWFIDVASFILWLKSVPLPEPFDLERHWESVNRVLRRHTTPRGIETNEHRELLIVQKE